ncbi:MAG: agmatinase [Calditrichota bacterium]
MSLNNLIQGAKFLECDALLEDAEIVVVGAGYDGTSSYRAGSRFAPQAVRAETLYSLESYSPYFKRDLIDLAVHDAGDIDMPFGDKSKALEMIGTTADEILEMNKQPFFIGGEHLITLPLVEAALQKYPNLHLIQLDAHLDLMDSLFGNRLSHGTVMRRIMDLVGCERIFQVGVRSGSREEFELAGKETQFFPFNTLEFNAKANAIGDEPFYLTVDLDVFDSSLIPGTGTPEAGGIFFPEFMQFLQAIHSLNIVACDVVELAPRIDSTGASTAVASKVIREMLMAINR